jgi:hypothetical protein
MGMGIVGTNDSIHLSIQMGMDCWTQMGKAERKGAADGENAC